MKDRTVIELVRKFPKLVDLAGLPEEVNAGRVKLIEYPSGAVYRSTFPGVNIDAAHKKVN